MKRRTLLRCLAATAAVGAVPFRELAPSVAPKGATLLGKAATLEISVDGGATFQRVGLLSDIQKGRLELDNEIKEEIIRTSLRGKPAQVSIGHTAKLDKSIV